MAQFEIPDFASMVLGETEETVEVDTSEALRDAALSMVRQASRSVDIVSRHLDSPVYDTDEFAEALRQVVVNSRRAQVRLLVQDARPLIGQGHRLLELCRRLSSYVEMRVPAHQHARHNSSYLLVDGTGVIFRQLSDRYEGVVRFNDPRQARLLNEELDEMWEVAKPDPNFRTLHV